MPPFAWQTLAETPQHILRASRNPAPASLLLTWPRPRIADLWSMLSMACARYAPLRDAQILVGHDTDLDTLVAEPRDRVDAIRADHRRTEDDLYMLACRPDLIPDTTPMIDAMLAQNA